MTDIDMIPIGRRTTAAALATELVDNMHLRAAARLFTAIDQLDTEALPLVRNARQALAVTGPEDWLGTLTDLADMLLELRSTLNGSRWAK